MTFELPAGALDRARTGYRDFLRAVSAGGADFRLTPRAEPTAYARCFVIFGLQLLKDDAQLAAGAGAWAGAIRGDLDAFRGVRRAAGADLAFDKPYLQLLTFSLSALQVLGRLDDDPLADHVLPLVGRGVDADLARARALEGAAGSGNQAMMSAILMLHARERLGVDDGGRVARWVGLHLDRMNPFGFWGGATSMSHLQFQNGYHQYEIFEYLDTPVERWGAAADHVASLADPDARFSLYPGGGGCYDYDAVFLITGAGPAAVRRHRPLLVRTASAILGDQNADGGFGESRCIRPRSAKNLARFVRHVRASRGAARLERLRHAITLLRPRHDRIHTHWSRYSREWGESNVWDSWFRLLTVARVQVALDPGTARQWGFIDFPGIGYHAALREGTGGRR